VIAESRKPPVTASPDEADAEAITWTLLLRSEVRDSEFRQALLRRDGYRCCITRWLEQKKWLDNGMPANELHAFLEAAHIIPFSFAAWAGSQVCFLEIQWCCVINYGLTQPRILRKRPTGGKWWLGASPRYLIVD
jgi:hypothetical protein